MKSLYTYLMIGSMALSSVAFTSCSDDDGVTPTIDLQTLNFTHEPGAGQITLKWTAPTDPENAGFQYMRLTYTDPRDKKTYVHNLSPYSKEIVIPNTRARYGATYSFTFVPYSESDTPGTPFVLDKCSSNAAPVAIKSTERKKLNVKAANLWTNSQEQSEGPLEQLVDGIKGGSNFFHTIWSGNVPAYSYVDIDLGKEVDRLEIQSWNRVNGGGFPQKVSWYRLEKMQDENVDITKDAFYTYDHKQGSGAQFAAMFPTSYEDPAMKPVRYLRYCGNPLAPNASWHMSELEFYEVIVNLYNPETDEEEVE